VLSVFSFQSFQSSKTFFYEDEDENANENESVDHNYADKLLFYTKVYMKQKTKLLLD